MTDDDYMLDIDRSIREAERIMDLTDVADLDEEDQEQAYEDRFHCGVCVTRTVMETVWPALDAYITYLQHKVKGSPQHEVEGSSK